jgi:polyhydroxybutyrate depolymerase
VAGPGTEIGRVSMPIPVHRATVAIFSGTDDPLVPYYGGPIGFGQLAQRRDGPAGRGIAVPAEVAAAEWAAANGVVGAPLIGRSTPPGDLPITLMTWRPELQGPPVVLYRIEGGGHTWPGGAQYLPSRIIGPVARTLDATGVLLTQFRHNENPHAR